MGQCAAVCNSSSKGIEEVYVDNLVDPHQKYSQSPYYPKLIYLQIKCKKFLKKKKNVSKLKSTTNSNRTKTKKINVNINMNVNMNNTAPSQDISNQSVPQIQTSSLEKKQYHKNKKKNKKKSKLSQLQN